jgi:diadenosine tetraphosphate (Ap4A) HIT family hydrolase
MSKEMSDLDFKNLSHWNYRIVRHKIAGGEYYRVHEVYYAKDGKLVIIAKDPEAAFGETPDELIADLELMLEHVLRSKDDIIDHDDAAIGSERNEQDGKTSTS